MNVKAICRFFAVGVGFSLAAGGASATSCDSILSCISQGNCSNEAAYRQNHPECFAGGSTTAAVSINATAFTQVNALTQALSARIRQNTPGPVAAVENSTGLAAGNSAQAWNIWASYSDNFSSVNVGGGGRNDNSVGTTVVGGDYALTPMMNVGISAAFDRNNGKNIDATNVSTTTGYSVAPYLGYQFSKELALDASVGVGRSKYASAGNTADGDRLFYATNLSYTNWMGNVQLTGKGSFLHGEESYADTRRSGATVAGTATKNKVDQARIGVQAGYWMSGFMPYAGLMYVADLRRSAASGGAADPLGRRALVLSLGANFFSLSSKVTGGIAYEQESGRTNSKNETLMANINIRF